MAKQNRTTLKGYFETGDIPTGGNYVDLIDSPLILDTENTGSINIPSNSVAIASGTSTANINFNNETNEYTGDETFTGTLFQNYYSSYTKINCSLRQSSMPTLH